MNIIQKFVYPLAIIFACAFASIGQTASPALEVLSMYPKVRDFTMSPSGDEAYVTLQSPNEEISTIAVLKKKKGKWQKPKKASFAGSFKDLEASLSPDGLTLYFVSNRPKSADETKPGDFDIWYVKRRTLKSEWTKPENLGAPVNSGKDEFYPSVSATGNMYFTREPMGEKKTPDIMFAGRNGSGYRSVQRLGDAINSDSHEYNSYIAPDESFIIFGAYRRPDGLGSGDIYISFRQEDGAWSKAKNMGKGFNSNQMDFCPFVDWKTKTLYFTSRRSAVAGTSFDSLEAFDAEVFKYENGLSRIYKISIAEMLK